MATAVPDVEDATEYLLQFLREKKHDRQPVANHGYGVYLSHVMESYLVGQGEPNASMESVRSTVSPPFFAAAWELCRLGILRPGLSNSIHVSLANAGGANGEGYSVTPYGEEWLATATTANAFLPAQPSRFVKVLVQVGGARFGPGFVQRSQEAVKARQALAYLACCAMCGAAAESIMLALAIAKRKDETYVLKEYRTASGRKKIENILLGGSTQSMQEDFRVFTSMLKYWRDESAHGRAVEVDEPQAYQALLQLLIFTHWARDHWDELTS